MGLRYWDCNRSLFAILSHAKRKNEHLIFNFKSLFRFIIKKGGYRASYKFWIGHQEHPHFLSLALVVIGVKRYCYKPLEPDFYGCPLMVDGKAYDCRLLIGDKEIELGKYYEIPVKFLDKDLALPNLAVGKSIVLLEGKEVADGEVTKICDHQ